MAKTHCPHGHLFSFENTYIGKNGHRHCRACHRIRSRKDYRQHHPKEAPLAPIVRLLKKVEIQPGPALTGCWEWTGHRRQRNYGSIGIGRRGRVTAHRFVYEHTIGPIPEGLEIDHLCCNQSCVNPLHLEPVTHRENMRRYALTGRAKS